MQILMILSLPVLLAATPATQPAAGAIGPRKEPQRIGTLHINRPGTYEDLLIDAEWADADAVQIRADNVTLRNCEIRNGRRDGIEVYGSDVLIENCTIHHFLAGSFREQKDAHGITGRPTRLTVRNCRIGFVSGDCLQFDPGRGAWTDVLIENCELFTGPLAEDAAGFRKGEQPGENAVDTKQRPENPRSSMTIRNCTLHGWKKGGQISNLAALNLKNHVAVTVENCVFYDNEIAMRLRGPGTDSKYGGAYVKAIDCAFHDCDVAIRAEDSIVDLKVFRPVFGTGVVTKLRQVGKIGAGFEMTEAVEAPERRRPGAQH